MVERGKEEVGRGEGKRRREGLGRVEDGKG
jgi:hypothetical protein